MVLKMLAAILAAVLMLSHSAIGASVAGGSSEDNIALPTTPAALFSDVYNNNSITVELLARQPQFTSTPYIQKVTKTQKFLPHRTRLLKFGTNETSDL